MMRSRLHQFNRTVLGAETPQQAVRLRSAIQCLSFSFLCQTNPFTAYPILSFPSQRTFKHLEPSNKNV